MSATPSARIVAVWPDPAHAKYVVLEVMCPLCKGRHLHGTRSKGLGPPPSRRRAAGCPPDAEVTDEARARGYRLHDPDCLILALDEAKLRS